MADIGVGEPQQPGNEQGKGKEGEGAVGLSHDGLVFAMLERFSGSLLWWEGYLKILPCLLNKFHQAVVTVVAMLMFGITRRLPHCLLFVALHGHSPIKDCLR